MSLILLTLSEHELSLRSLILISLIYLAMTISKINEGLIKNNLFRMLNTSEFSVLIKR